MRPQPGMSPRLPSGHTSSRMGRRSVRASTRKTTARSASSSAEHNAYYRGDSMFSIRSRTGYSLARALIAVWVFLLSAHSALAGPVRANADIAGVVTDSASGQPLPSAEVSIMQGTQVIANASTDAFGRYTAHNISPGSYTVTARFLGFGPQSKPITVGDSNADVRVDFALNAVAISRQGVTVNAAVPLAVDTRSGDQRFKQDQYHGAPTNTTSQILQQSIAGAARAPTGEVHIRR